MEDTDSLLPAQDHARIAEQFKADASLLQEQGSARSSVSRCYYAVYHELLGKLMDQSEPDLRDAISEWKERLAKKGQGVPKSLHRFLREEIQDVLELVRPGSLEERNRRTVKTVLGRLWVGRVQADYGSQDLIQADANGYLEDAQTLRRMVDRWKIC